MLLGSFYGLCTVGIQSRGPWILGWKFNDFTDFSLFYFNDFTDFS